MKITLRVRGLILKSIGAFGFLIFIALYLPTHAEVGGADWKFLEMDDEGIWFYNSENIEFLPYSLRRVQTKKVYDEEGVSKAVEKYGKNYMNLEHVLSVWEIDCSHRKFRLLSAIFYSKNNSIIQGYDDEKEKHFRPEDIPADSYLELLYKKVCK